MTFEGPGRMRASQITEGAIRRYERDKKDRERRRLKLAREMNDPSLGPGMWP